MVNVGKYTNTWDFSRESQTKPSFATGRVFTPSIYHIWIRWGMEHAHPGCSFGSSGPSMRVFFCMDLSVILYKSLRGNINMDPCVWYTYMDG